MSLKVAVLCTGKFDRLIQCDNMLCVDIRDIAEGRNIESTGDKTEQVDSDYMTRIIHYVSTKNCTPKAGRHKFCYFSNTNNPKYTFCREFHSE